MEPVGGGGDDVVRRVVGHEVSEVHVAVGGGGGRGGSFLRHGCAGAWWLSALVQGKTRSESG
jgi:hypothetical protein